MQNVHNSQINSLLLNPDVGEVPSILLSLFNVNSLTVFILCGRHSATAVVQKRRNQEKGRVKLISTEIDILLRF